MIEVQNITKRFDTKTAVNGLTLKIEPGEATIQKNLQLLQRRKTP